MKDFADGNFQFDIYSRKFSKQLENTVEKGEIAPFSHRIFKRLVLQTCKNQGLFGKGLTSTPHNILYKPLAAFLNNGSIETTNSGRREECTLSQ